MGLPPPQLHAVAAVVAVQVLHSDHHYALPLMPRASQARCTSAMPLQHVAAVAVVATPHPLVCPPPPSLSPLLRRCARSPI